MGQKWIGKVNIPKHGQLTATRTGQRHGVLRRSERQERHVSVLYSRTRTAACRLDRRVTPVSSSDSPQDQLPRPDKLPQPEGWFEVFCCLAVVLTFVAFLLFLGLYH